MVNLNLRHKCLEFTTEGKIVYDPDRKGMKANTEHWAIITMTDDDLAAYYRHQFFKKFNITLDKPSWEPHITVLKNAKEYNKEIPWGYRDQEIIEVNYGHELFWNHEHVWLNAYSEAFYDLIYTYYITRNYGIGHITIGRFNKKDIGRIAEFKSYRD